MELQTVYAIETRHGRRDYDNFAFKSREACERIINGWAVSEYGKPVYPKDSEEVSQVVSYWRGDISYEELKSMQKKKHDDAMASALYYDYISNYHIKGITIIDNE